MIMGYGWVTSIVMTCFMGCGQSKQGVIAHESVHQIRSIEKTTEAAGERNFRGQLADTLDFDLNYIMGKFNPENHPDFLEIPEIYRDGQVRYMRRDAFEAFQMMYVEALKEGVKLRIVSATRNFDHQKRIWENKWTGKTTIETGANALKIYPDASKRALKILEYSSMPGTSRHHWGTDVDFNALNNAWFENGEGQRVYQWLTAHASNFGFCQPYTALGEKRLTGYQEEKWHWTYVPVASEIQKKAQLLLKNEVITGFLGAETAIELDVVGKYVWGIHADCYPYN